MKNKEELTFRDVVIMFNLLRKQGYKVEDIMQMNIDVIKEVRENTNKE